MVTIIDSSRQVLYKLEYINKGGWSTSVWKEFETGKDLLRLAKLEEVVPNLEAYYITNPHRVNKFNLITFSHLIEWETIKELVRERRIYVKTAFDKSTIKSSQGNSDGTGTFAKQEEGRRTSRTLFDAS